MLIDISVGFVYNKIHKRFEFYRCGAKNSFQNNLFFVAKRYSAPKERFMKFKRSVAITIFLMLLCATIFAACTTVHSHNFSETWSSDADNHWKECSCGAISQKESHVATDWIVDIPATETTEGSRHIECAKCGVVLQYATIDKITATSSRTVDFYAINDFHGEVDKLSTVAGYLSEVKYNNENTVLLNSGDMFQGSMESNSNYGSLLTQCMDDVGFDAFTYGNHEFDWGLSVMENLSASSSTPFLGANIYHWDSATKTWGSFASELAQEYVVKTLPNGLRIGIIGVIGKDQITSISSNLVQTIGFKDPAEVVPQLSQKLREELKCDIVVVSAHTGEETFLENSSFDITRYVDAVFCAHTHKNEVSIKNGVPFIQGGSSGEYVSHVTLSVDDNGNVSCTNRQNIKYSSAWPNKVSVQNLIDNSNEQLAQEANEVLATLDGTLDADEGLPRLVCHAIANYVQQNYADQNVVLSMTNKGRSDLYGGELTYSELYEAVPFDNVIYIARVSGADILKEAGYGSNFVWRISGEAIENSNDVYYNIAVIDYLLFHQNSERNYDYFPSAFQNDFEPIALENENFDGVYNYRFLTRDFLREQGEINCAIYNNIFDRTNKSKLDESVYFSNENVLPHGQAKDDPYTVAEALTLAQSATSNAAYKGYVKGIVSNLSGANVSNDGRMYEIYISDDSGAELYVYRVYKNAGQDRWTSASQLEEGCEVVLWAELYSYNGTPEVGGGYVVSINGEPT